MKRERGRRPRKRVCSFCVDKVVSMDYKEGQYILMNFEGEGRTSQEIERIMKISDDVIRFLTVRKED